MQARFLAATLSAACLAAPAEAEVQLSGGFWTSTFADCPEGDLPSGNFCGGWEAEDASYTCPATAPLHSQITTAANHAGGAGGGGFRMFQGDERNVSSSGLALRLATPEPELWLRYYTRYPDGQTWGDLLEHKMIYFFTDAQVAMDVNFPKGLGSIQLQPRGTMGSPDITVAGWGWSDLYGGEAGDGSWHVYEHHLDLGTSGQNDGVYQFWVDGALRVNFTDLDFFDGGAANPSGWAQIYVPSNHNRSTLAGCNGIDLDDFALAGPSYGGFVLDAAGLPMLGGLSGSPSPPAAPSSLTVV